jgi:periplasmic protein TonB
LAEPQRALPSAVTAPSRPPAPTPQALASVTTTHAEYKTAYLQNPPPNYPILSKRMGESGTVVLWVSVNAAGAVDDLGVLKTSSYARLDDAALKAVKQWRFIPAKRAGEPVADKVSVPIEFAL